MNMRIFTYTAGLPLICVLSISLMIQAKDREDYKMTDKEFSHTKELIAGLTNKKKLNQLKIQAEKVHASFVKAIEHKDENGIEQYSHLMFSLYKAFNDNDFNDYQQYILAEEYTLLTLKKHKVVPLDVLRQLFTWLYFQNEDKYSHGMKEEEYSKFRKKRLEVWFQVWRYIGDEMIDNWDPSQLPETPSPPRELEAGVSGMAPESIKDPKLRKKYQKALDKFEENVKKHARQSQLRDVKKRLQKLLESYLPKAYAKEPVDRKELQHYLDIISSSKLK